MHVRHKKRDHKKTKKNYEPTRTAKFVYDLLAPVPEFFYASDEEKLSIALNFALNLGIPYSTAIRVAYLVLQRSRE